MEEGVIYSYLDMPAGSSTSSSAPPAQTHTHSQCPPWHRIALRLGWAGNIILLGVAIALLAVLVCQNPQPDALMPMTSEKSMSHEIHRIAAVCSHSLEDLRNFNSLEALQTCLKQNLCEVETSSAEESRCKLCPRHWLLHKDKCYWISENTKYWTRSHEDCSRRRSHLLVIEDWEEMAFIQKNITDENPVWIGLNIISPGRNWTWVDGSLLNQTLFTVSGHVEENSCATIEKKKIQSEICNTNYRWICQKKALLI